MKYLNFDFPIQINLYARPFQGKCEPRYTHERNYNIFYQGTSL